KLFCTAPADGSMFGCPVHIFPVNQFPRPPTACNGVLLASTRSSRITLSATRLSLRFVRSRPTLSQSRIVLPHTCIRRQSASVSPASLSRTLCSCSPLIVQSRQFL